MTAKKENRGGARPNSGPKPFSLSASQVKELLRTVKKFAKEHGKSIDDILVGMVYAEKITDNNRLAAIKLVKDLSAPKISEGGTADTQLGPSIYLPEQKPILAAVTDIQKAKKAKKNEEGG